MVMNAPIVTVTAPSYDEVDIDVVITARMRIEG
jgi:hypothetical protein